MRGEVDLRGTAIYFSVSGSVIVNTALGVHNVCLFRKPIDDFEFYRIKPILNRIIFKSRIETLLAT